MAAGESIIARPKSITRPKVIATEGVDAKIFFIWAYQAFGLSELDFQVEDIGGNQELPVRLQTLVETTGFENNAKSLLIVRDAETSAQSALQSVQGTLCKVTQTDRFYAARSFSRRRITGFSWLNLITSCTASRQTSCCRRLLS